MACSYWREAATLLVIGRSSLKSGKKIIKQNINSWDTNYNVLFMKRSAKSSFMPEFCVFPGGTIDEADRSLHWLNLFKEHGFGEKDLYKMFRFDVDRPYLYSNNSSNQLLPEIAFRICALRETFEETGLLLSAAATNAIDNKSLAYKNIMTVDEIEDWRLKVHKDANQFLRLFYHIDKLPDVWNLYEWMTWLTPTFFGGKNRRFDTAFYITFLDYDMPELSHCIKEADELKIEKPYEMLKAHHNGKVVLPPPQLLELGRLLNFSDFQNLRNFSEERCRKGMSRWLPVKIVTKNGFLTVLPGDDLYPSDPDYHGISSDKELKISLSTEESRMLSKNLNRFENQRSKPVTLVTNISSEYGHVNAPDIKFT